MDIKRISSCISRLTLSRLICLLFVFSSFGHLVASQKMLLNLRSAAPKIRPFARQAIPRDLKIGTGNRENKSLSYQDLPWIDQKFQDFTNALFRYDARIQSAQSELTQWQKCLKTDFENRIGNCTDLTNAQLQEKITLLGTQITELTENRDRIVTMQDALQDTLKKYWYALIPIIAAGGLVAYNLKSSGTEEKNRLSPEPAEKGVAGEEVENKEVANNATELGDDDNDNDDDDIGDTAGLTEQEIAMRKYDALVKRFRKIEERSAALENLGREYTSEEGKRLRKLWDDDRRIRQKIEALEPILFTEALQEYKALGDSWGNAWKRELELQGKQLEDNLDEAESRELKEIQAMHTRRDYLKPLLGKSY